MQVARIPRRIAGKPPQPAAIEVVGEWDLSGHDRQGSGEVFAQLDRVPKAADAVDALREAPDIHRREIVGDFLSGDSSREDDPVSQGASRQTLQLLSAR